MLTSRSSNFILSLP